MSCMRASLRWLCLVAVVCAQPFDLACLALPAQEDAPPDLHLNDPKPTTILVRVVAHGSMVLGKEVGGARVTITDVGSGQILATGIQQGDAGDQNQIMRTPRLMEEAHYSSRPSAVFTATLDLVTPTLVDIAAEGPLAFPAATQRVSTRAWLIPGHDLTSDGIVLTLYGYIVQIEHPKSSGGGLIAKDAHSLRRTRPPPWRLGFAQSPYLRRAAHRHEGDGTFADVLQRRQGRLRSALLRPVAQRRARRHHSPRCRSRSVERELRPGRSQVSGAQ